MSKLEVLVSATKITFVNNKGQAQSDELFEKMGDSDAVQSLCKEQKAAQSASKGAISLLVDILNSPRLDGYKGTCPLNESPCPELKSAIRELEIEFLKPIFCGPHLRKGAKEATVETLWQAFMGDLKAGGSYAVAKSEATKYFAYCGKLPQCDNGMMLTVASIKKLVHNAKDGMVKPDDLGISGKLIALAHDLDTRTEGTIVGDTASAVAALRAMLATFEGLQQQDMEAAQAAHTLKRGGNVAAAAATVIGSIAKAPARAKA